LVKFLGTSIQGNLLRSLEDEKSLMRYYHSELVQVIHARRDSSPQVADFIRDYGEYSFDKLWEHWELAIVDWYRFMTSWGFWGNDKWVDRRAREITSRWKKENAIF
jgi:hypothetical protein